jgi:phosphopantothenoylcysteine decarboxylase/phosphopantothenate--cysteine ligase
VADYRPAEMAAQKIKKTGDTLTLTLVKNPDIAAALGQQKRPNQRLVGFALETNDAEANAQEKLRRKQMDFIVMNTLQDEGAGFGGDTNKVTIYTADNKSHHFQLSTKRKVAEDIVGVVLNG